MTTYFYPPNRVIFEAASFFGGNPSAENIQAIMLCKGYHTGFEKLNEMFHAWPEFREFGRTVLVKEFVAYKQRMLSMINKSAEERYTELIRNSQDLFLHAQLKHIASYLGMTDTSLSRIRRESPENNPCESLHSCHLTSRFLPYDNPDRLKRLVLCRKQSAMSTLPVYVPLVFGIAIILALYFFYRASGYSRVFLVLACIWIVLQSLISLSGFYTRPPRFPLLVLPPSCLALSIASP